MEFKNTSWGILSVSNIPWASLGKLWLSFSIKLILRAYWIILRIYAHLQLSSSFPESVWCSLCEKCPYSEFFWSAFSDISPYLSVFCPKAGKYGREKLRTQILFTKWFVAIKLGWTLLLSLDHLLPLWLGHLFPEGELFQEGWESFEP